MSGKDDLVAALRAELDKIDDILRSHGFEYPLGSRGVADLALHYATGQDELHSLDPEHWAPRRAGPGSRSAAPAQPRYVVIRTDGRPIPADEPCFVVRGQDAFAIRAIQAYIDLTVDVVRSEVTGQLCQHLERIRAWQAGHPPKLPD